MIKMYAVVGKRQGVLASICLMEVDALALAEAMGNGWEVEEFKLDWEHWVEARKTLGIY